jgi:hypothetical protein
MRCNPFKRHQYPGKVIGLCVRWYRRDAAHPLCKIIASRNQKHSTALVTNVDFDKWGECLADGPLAMAFLDRLVEGAIKP